MTLDYVSFLEHLQVKKHPLLQNQHDIIPAITKVLSWSQWFMRDREVGYKGAATVQSIQLYKHTSAFTL